MTKKEAARLKTTLDALDAAIGHLRHSFRHGEPKHSKHVGDIGTTVMAARKAVHNLVFPAA